MIIHGHPQKSSYQSAAEWPKISHQSHWLIGHHIAHMHVDLKAPAYGEVNTGESVTCEFAIVLHHFAGRVVYCIPGFDKAGMPDSLIWDATGTSEPPAMEGDPHGDRTFTGRFTVSLKPEMSGWWPIQVDTRAIMDDGRTLFANAFIPIWANQEYDGPGKMEMHKPFISGKGGVSPIAGPDGINDDPSFVHYGQVVVEYGHFLPLSGISAPWVTAPAFYAYDGRRVPPSRNEMRLDLDLHNDIPGTTLVDVTQAETQFFSIYPFLPAWGHGQHKVALIKTIEDPSKNEMLAGLLVVFPSVDLNAEPVLFTPDSGVGPVNPPNEPPIIVNPNSLCREGETVTTDDGAVWTLGEANEGGGSIAREILRDGVRMSGRVVLFLYKGGVLYGAGGTDGLTWYRRSSTAIDGAWTGPVSTPSPCGA